MSRRVARAGVTGLAMVLVLAGCGGGGGGVSLSMTSGAASQLRTGVDAVHAAVAGGDRTQAGQALANLQTTVTRLREQVSSDRAAAIVGAAADVEAQLGLLPTTTSTSTTSTSTTTTTPDHPSKKGPKGGRAAATDSTQPWPTTDDGL